MGHKTLFRVLVRVLGVWLTIQGLAQIAMFASQMLHLAIAEESVTTMFNWFWTQGAYGVVMTGGGLYCFVGSRHLANFAFRDNHVYCGSCGWDLTQVTAERCPECDAIRQQTEESSSRPRRAALLDKPAVAPVVRFTM